MRGKISKKKIKLMLRRERIRLAAKRLGIRNRSEVRLKRKVRRRLITEGEKETLEKARITRRQTKQGLEGDVNWLAHYGKVRARWPEMRKQAMAELGKRKAAAAKGETFSPLQAPEDLEASIRWCDREAGEIYRAQIEHAKEKARKRLVAAKKRKKPKFP